jgi:hypothetical protein
MNHSVRRTFTLSVALVASLSLSAATLLAVPGDSDLDGDVDNYDLTMVLNNYGIDSGGNPFNGDADQDGDVDADDFAVTSLAFNFTGSVGGSGAVTGPTPNPTPARLLYHPGNGSLSIDPTNAPGGVITSFILRSLLSFQTAATVNYPFPVHPMTSTNLAMHTTSVIAETDPGAILSPSGFANSPHNLGPVLPPGLTMFTLVSNGVSGMYVGAVVDAGGAPLGSPGLQLHSFDLVVVPEPAAASLAVAWPLALNAMRRRTRPPRV